MREIEFIIPQEYNRRKVLDILTSLGVSKRLITKLKQIDNGITLNDKHIRTIDIVSVGDILKIKLFDDKILTPNSSLNVNISFEDNDIIVFDKPFNMPVHPSHKHLDDTLGNFFAHHCDGLTFRPINRLDRDTSGLCVVAKNRFSAPILQKSLSKVYYAIVCGKISGSGTINKPIGRVDKSIITRCVDENGQNAITHYEVLQTGEKYSLVRVILDTGRTHQIRVHFSHIGYPLAGDDMYGGNTEDISRQALHCGEVSFLHPVEKTTITIKSNLPSDMISLL